VIYALTICDNKYKYKEDIMTKPKVNWKQDQQNLYNFMRQNGSEEIARGKFSQDKNIQEQRRQLINQYRQNQRPIAQQGQNRPMPATRPPIPTNSNLSNPATLQSMLDKQNGQEILDRSGNPTGRFYGQQNPAVTNNPSQSRPQFGNLIGSINKVPQNNIQPQQAPLNQANNSASQNNEQPTTQPTSPMQAQPNQQPQQAEAPAQDNAAIDQQIAALQAQIQQLQSQKK